ncbi:MAG: hypothetical protein K2J06_06915 [Muribaculaceae bacterium]|nr:hypothetical protein [Muribaculaceae bacterium]
MSDFPYEDIVNLPHHVSARHPQMSLENRAAQFAPFAALTGHDAALAETARMTSSRVDLSADQYQTLSRRLAYALSFADRPEIRITYFRPDGRKEGGAYVTVTGIVRKVEEPYDLLTLTDNTEISLSAITDIRGAIFDDLD